MSGCAGYIQQELIERRLELEAKAKRARCPKCGGSLEVFSVTMQLFRCEVCEFILTLGEMGDLMDGIFSAPTQP